MIKAVIFDMFETLVTLCNSFVYKARQISADAGIAEEKFREIWNPSDEERTLGIRTLEDVIEEILKVNDCYSPKLFDTIITKRKNFKVESFKNIHPEIIPLFKQLKERGIKIGLITNCYFEESDVIRESIFYEYFDSVWMSCEVGMKKPDAGIYISCMEDLEVLPKECVYVGDGGSFELEAAKSLGMHPLQATWYLREGADQPAKRKEEFRQACCPLDIMDEINRYTMDK